MALQWASKAMRRMASSSRGTRELSTYALPALKYKYDALEPHIDATTMQIHHTRHHQTYVSSLNRIVGGEHGAAIQGLGLDEVLKACATLPEAIRTPTVNHAGGHFNHTLFFHTLRADADGARDPVGDLRAAIDDAFGGVDAFKDQFSAAATKVFGSGWAWLVLDEHGKLAVTSTPNQENPLMTGVVANPGTPILGIDVWEHAYYLKHQNKRPAYIDAFWNVVDWDVVAENWAKAVDGDTALVQVPMEEE